MEKDRIVHNEILGMKGLKKIFNDICLKICTLIRWKIIVGFLGLISVRL